MGQWRNFLTASLADIEQRFDELALRVAHKLGLDEPLVINPYLGYGRPDRVKIKGRVLENDNILKATDRDSVWDNILNAYRQLESDEIPGAVVQGAFGGVTATAVTDDEGYFDLEFALPQPLPDHTLWHDVSLTLLEAPVTFEGDVQATGRVLVPPTDSQFGIISDIDDTVLQSDATSYLSAARLLLLHNARTRLPFPGVAAFLSALQDGTREGGQNPLFYVSSSPWNIFPLLTDFMAFQKIPLGPLFLKDYGISKEQLLFSGHGKHKLRQIDEIFSTFAELPFVLIGDSGQEDPEIYAEIVRRYPGRVRAVYIRDVAGPKRDEEIATLIKALAASDVPFQLVPDSYAAAEHAAAIGLLQRQALPAIAGEITDEAQRRTPLAKYQG